MNSEYALDGQGGGAQRHCHFLLFNSRSAELDGGQSVHDRQDNNVPLSLKLLWDGTAMACQKINERMLRRFRQRCELLS